MKFSVQKVLDNARWGLINGIERLPEIRIESPNILLYTRGGALPYLTEDILEKITKDHVILYFPVPTIIGIHERMEKFNGTIGDFTGMSKHLTYVSIVDSAEKRITGYHTKDNVPIWGKAGKTDINSRTYMSFMEALKPDLFTTLCDCDTDINSSNKRVFKSVARSLDFFEKCIEIFKNSSKLKNSKIIGSLVGGFNKEAREKLSETIGKAPIFAVSVDGLHDCSKDVEFISANQVKPLVEASLVNIPADVLRICHGSWNPNTLLELVSSGIDIFDTSYPYLAAEDGRAFIFANDESIYLEREINLSLLNGQNQEDNKISQSLLDCNGHEEPVNKKPKMTDTTYQFYISLKDPLCKESLEPISAQCSCLTCKNHTKAYIHHLLNVKEILGPTLLMIHNIHHYIKFFNTIRTSLKNGNFDNLKRSFNAKYDSKTTPDDQP